MKSPGCSLCTYINTRLYFRNSWRSYYQCTRCNLVFVPAAQHITREQEKKRYDQHHNSPDDAGYRNFLSRILPPLVSRIPAEARGLDYGSGPSPVLAMMLRKMGFETEFIDPCYHDYPKLMSRQYDFVTCTEVVEHFRNPRQDWTRLTGLLKKGGWLAVMTRTIPENEAFGQWFYQMDKTHICFYTDATFRWIAGQYNLKMEPCDHSVIMFQR